MTGRRFPSSLSGAIFCAISLTVAAQTAPPGAQPAGPSGATSLTTTLNKPDAPVAHRITGIETNREMIAAEAPTEIVINGSPGSNCGLMVDYGDGTSSTHVVSATSPFPLRIKHTYLKTADHSVRALGIAQGSAVACAGAVDAALHVSPAGSKIEYVTLSINACPEGWSLVGNVSADKSFRCTPIPDASAPTNLIHCTEGMKYFARSGFIGCSHPAMAHLAAATPTPEAGKAKATAQKAKPEPKKKSAKAPTKATPAKPAAKPVAKPA